MTQNRSHAVMAQRTEPHDSLDFFPTPPWGTRALCRYVLDDWDWHGKSVWEPACGQGHMARPLAEFFSPVYASDIHPYGFGAVDDFLFPGQPQHQPDWIITNPPFNLAIEFAERALAIAPSVALLTRLSWLATDERFKLFKRHPPVAHAVFMGRLPMHKGKCERSASTATDYCWTVWRSGHSGATGWVRIPPGARDELQRWGDYDGEIGLEPAKLPKRRRVSA